MQDKRELRRIMLAKRRLITAEEQAAASAAICDAIGRVLAEHGHKKGVILSYLPYGREIDLGRLHTELWQQGTRLAVPRTFGLPDGNMEAALYLPQDKLTKTALGVYEPLEAPVVALQDIGVVLAPGVAFDKAGNRLGHGKGYYDRYLAMLPEGALTIGVAYAWQIVDELPTEDFDLPMDMVICG